MNTSERARLDYEWNSMGIVDRVDWLRARVERIEQHPQWADVQAASELRESIPSAELARLRRIEEAAKIAHVWLLVGGESEAYDAREKLGEALKR